MRYIVISGPAGVRKIEEIPGKGASFTLGQGENVVGFEGDSFDLNATGTRSTSFWILDKLASYFGIAVADLILYSAKAFGIEPCAVCEMRYKILHVIDQIGMFKAIKLLAKTIRGQDLTPAEIAQVQASFKVTP